MARRRSFRTPAFISLFVGLLALSFALPVLAAPGDTVADLVLGQPNFTSDFCNAGGSRPTDSSLCSPRGVAIGPDERLFVSDSPNNRVLSWPNHRALSNGQPADLVLGQSNFASGNCNRTGGPPSAVTLCTPTGLAVTPNGVLYVADSSNHRVLRYNPPFHTGKAAARVYGQSSFSEGKCNRSVLADSAPSAQMLCSPTGVYARDNGTVVISDGGNNRVLGFFSHSTTAQVVLGQANFTSRGCNRGLAAPTSMTLCDTMGIEPTPTGQLVVTDRGNNRVLVYSPPFQTGMAASVALGQPDLTSDDCQAGADGLCFPNDVAVDRGGRVFVSDASNNRVLLYAPPFATGMAATGVLGQEDFDDRSCSAPSATTLCIPGGVIVSKTQLPHLYVTDVANHRVLRFTDPFPLP